MRSGGPTAYMSDSPESQAALGALQDQQRTSDADIMRAGTAKADAAREVAGFDSGNARALQDYQRSVRPIEEFQPRQVSGEEMMNFAGLAMIVSTLGSRMVKGDVAMGLNGAASAMRGYNEGNLQQARVDMDNFRLRMNSAMQHNKDMLDRYNTIMADRRLSLQQKMQQYSIAAHEYQDTIALSALREGRLQQVLDRNDRITAGMNQMAQQMHMLDVQAWRADQQANKPQIIQNAQGTYRVDPSTGQAVPVTLADGTPMPGKGPEGKALPAGAAGKLLENQTNLRRAERALTLVQGQNVGDASGDTASTGWKGYLGDAALQRLDPQGVDARAAIGDLGSLVIHDRSGAAVTAAEFPRLRPFIPQVTDDQATVQKKLKRFVEVYREIVDDTRNFYTESGYLVPGLSSGGGSRAPAATAPQRIAGDADYNALPSGTEFIGPDGKRRRKP